MFPTTLRLRRARLGARVLLQSNSTFRTDGPRGMFGKLGTRTAHAGGKKRDGWQDRHRMLVAAEADVCKDPRALDALLLRGALG